MTPREEKIKAEADAVYDAVVTVMSGRAGGFALDDVLGAFERGVYSAVFDARDWHHAIEEGVYRAMSEHLANLADPGQVTP